MAQVLETIALIIGIAAIVAGVAMIHAPTAFIVFGVIVVLLALLFPTPSRRTPERQGDK